MASIWLAHITVYDESLPGTKVLYFSSSPYVTGTSGLPPDGVANTYYEPRIQQPAIMRQDIFDNATTFGQSRTGYGALELVNNDGVLDDFINYGLDGREIKLILGEIQPSDTTPTWTVVMTGTMEQPEVDWNKVSIRIRDRQAELDVPLYQNTYAGDNVLPDGLEGVIEDLKGKPKPVLFGSVFNVSPPSVNTSKLIYQVNDGAINTVDKVYDRGVELTKGTDYTSESDMTSNAPSSGSYRVYPAGGYFRLGAKPDGEVTCDATQGAAAANRTVAQILKTIATNYAGIAAGDVNSTDVTALDTANSNVVGYWTDGNENCKAVMDEICNSIGAWYGFDRLGKLRMSQLVTPSGSPVAYFETPDIISMDRVVTNDEGRGVSIWKAKLNYKKFYTTQTSDLAGSVTDSRRSELKEGFRTVYAEDSSIKTKHLLAPELKFDTLLTTESDAQAEVDRRLALYKAERSVYDLRIILDGTGIAAISLGEIIQVTAPRFDFHNGKLLRVIGMRPNLRLRIVDITAWG